MPDITIDYYRLKPVSRSQLEYPTADVSFAYLAAIDRVMYCKCGDMWECHPEYFSGFNIVTKDVFADKAVFAAVNINLYPYIVARQIDSGNLYVSCYETVVHSPPSDRHSLYKSVSAHPIIIASEAYSAEDAGGRGWAISCTGSTVKSMRFYIDSPVDPLDLPSPAYTIVATDTSFASGRFGYRNMCATSSPQGGTTPDAVYLKNPMTSIPRPTAILEIPVAGSGEPGDPFRPLLLSSVSWGSFEFDFNSATNIVAVVSRDKAVENQIDFARSKNLRVLKPPKDYSEAVEQFNTLKKEFPHWLAGKDNWAYQTLGDEVFDLMQNIDFYHGELIEHKTHLSQIKQVPDNEIRRRINTLKKELSKASTLTEQRDKHLAKLAKIERLGW